MGGRDSLDGIMVQDSHAPFQTEINVSETLAVMRGVKRQRVRRDLEDHEGGRSFLETKWEKMAERKRGFLPFFFSCATHVILCAVGLTGFVV